MKGPCGGEPDRLTLARLSADRRGDQAGDSDESLLKSERRVAGAALTGRRDGIILVCANMGRPPGPERSGTNPSTTTSGSDAGALSQKGGDRDDDRQAQHRCGDS
jgi:hypothetical protein